MSTLRLHSIDLLATMAGDAPIDDPVEITNAAIMIRDGWIEQVGTTQEVSGPADESVDLSGHVVLPGLVNTHHHLWQTLARTVPTAQDATLGGWLRALFPLWTRLTPEAIRTAARIGAVELALSGCTTTADHHFVWPSGCRVDDLVEGIEPVGIRAHLTRATMTDGAAPGRVSADPLAEDEAAALAAAERAVARFHDPTPGAMIRIVLGPAALLSVSRGLMREMAELARQHGIGLHTHLAETAQEAARCVAATGLKPLQYLEDAGWLGPDVWFAHAIHHTSEEIQTLVTSGAGVAHCPTSNMRLGSGIAPLRAWLRTGVRVGLGVDGAASNDTSNLLAEARQAMLLARVADAVRPNPDDRGLLSARSVLRLATRGGADVLGRSDIGVIAPGKAADLIAVDLARPQFSGAHDPLAALVFCGLANVDHSWVHGRRVVANGRLSTVDVGELVRDHRKLAGELTV